MICELTSTTVAEQGAAPDRLQLHSFPTALPLLGALVVNDNIAKRKVASTRNEYSRLFLDAIC